MSDHVYKSVEITGSSPDGIQPAIDNALAKAPDPAQPRLVRGRRHPRRPDDGATHYQVTLKIGFRLE